MVDNQKLIWFDGPMEEHVISDKAIVVGTASMLALFGMFVWGYMSGMHKEREANAKQPVVTPIMYDECAYPQPFPNECWCNQ